MSVFQLFLTFALQTLSQETPKQGATVVTESGDLVVVDSKLVRHVDAETLGTHLQGEQSIVRIWPPTQPPAQRAH